MRGKNSVWKAMLFVVPFCLGVVGLFVVEKQPILDAMYSCVQMYMLDYGGENSNLFIELARWLAPLATASGILLAATRAGTAMKNRLRYWRGNTVAVYGDEESVHGVLAQLGKRGIRGTDKLVRAHSYILLGNEEENLAFYHMHRKQLEGRMVYMRSTALQAHAAQDPELKLFSAEETAARLFWQRQALYSTSVANGHRLQIGIVGFDRLGQELLNWGLQNLIFDPAQQIEYHVFADGEAYSALHPERNQIGDRVCFYTTPWYQNVECLEKADMVIVTQHHGQTALVADMLHLLQRDRIHVFGDAAAGLQLLDGQERLRVFYWQQAAQNVSYIMDEQLLERAKRINLRYARLYSGVAETAENRELEWKKLDAFTRYSNISAADYHTVRLQMLQAMGEDIERVTHNPQVLELLAQLEHIRWCRYHYLNNWRYGIPENGKAKDAKRRIHSALVPYEALPEGEKEKDRENIRVLLSLG